MEDALSHHSGNTWSEVATRTWKLQQELEGNTCSLHVILEDEAMDDHIDKGNAGGSNNVENIDGNNCASGGVSH